MFDAVVIGGGVVGCAILRELCRHDGKRDPTAPPSLRLNHFAGTFLLLEMNQIASGDLFSVITSSC
jgi:hypothetical protein